MINTSKIIFLVGVFMVLPLITLAHPGNTASDGCHYCRTNCSSWGETWNARHCHNGGYSYSNSYSNTATSHDDGINWWFWVPFMMVTVSLFWPRD